MGEHMLIELDEKTQLNLTYAEQEVVDYINNHGDAAIEQSITELAEFSYTSIATVSRAIRKCGFTGIPDLRLYLARKLSHRKEHYAVNKVLSNIYQECTNTIDNLKISDIMKIVEYIKKSKQIYVIARGDTSFVAECFVHRLQLMKYNCFLTTDSEVIRRLVKLVDKDDMVITFTAHNTTPEFEIAQRDCRKMGIPIVTCICKSGTVLEELSDVTIVGYNTAIDGLFDFCGASRLPLEIIARIIIEYLSHN